MPGVEAGDSWGPRSVSLAASHLSSGAKSGKARMEKGPLKFAMSAKHYINGIAWTAAELALTAI